ncbi:MAG: hypothetical protein Q8O64_05185 [Sideroxyarcus sp.]|nr:hypothetical protein [Sideroxyarcus sp.]
MFTIFTLLPPPVEHSITLALLFVVIAFIAWFLDALVHYMRRQNLDPFLCKVFYLTAVSLAVLDCFLVLHYALSFALTVLGT